MQLTPTMSSRTALTLDWITRWLGEHPGSSPSLREIARGTSTSKDRAAAAVRALVAQGRLLRRAGSASGQRAVLSLPSERDRAVQLLRELGVIVDEDVFAFVRPATLSTLPMMPWPAQTAGGGAGSGDGGSGAERG